MRDPLRISEKPLIFPAGIKGYRAVRCIGLADQWKGTIRTYDIFRLSPAPHHNSLLAKTAIPESCVGVLFSFCGVDDNLLF